MLPGDCSNLTYLIAGPEVQGKYSADLFVKRAQSIFKAQQSGSDNKPWFTYLSFQSVHDPLQVEPSAPLDD